MLAGFPDMEQTPVLKRLYVGGLAHSISEAELQERFSKFGNVSETEIVTRKDDQGKPTKTFAYINITLSEKELKRCLSILNKTKWKGGTLQIELAKESFLHRLARERQEANMKKEKKPNNGIKNIIESLKESGIVDFHVKAVPGTEVPNHKDWVVGKFGRVLPIVHMKNRQKNKIIKYDPSKYCHNLKKLDQDITERVPISQLTWSLEEGEDSVSKKRQGQYSESKFPKKKMKVQDSNGLGRTELNLRTQHSPKTQIVTPPERPENNIRHAKKQSQEQKFGASLPSFRNLNMETDTDSEEEIRALIAREQKIQKSTSNNQHEDNVEVVGDNFELKYSTHWSLQEKHHKVMHTGCNKVRKTVENESDCDSVDTDEIIAVTKTPKKKEKSKIVKELKEASERRNGKPKKVIVTHICASESSDSHHSVENKQKGGNKATPVKASLSNGATQQDSILDTSHSVESESSDSYDTSQSEEDEEYKVLKQSCYRLDLTLEDLGKLVSESTEVTDENSGNNWSDTGCSTSHIRKKRAVTTNSKKHICPDEIVSALLEESSDDDDDDDDDDIKKKNSHLKVQPFRGIRSLNKEMTKDGLDVHKIKVNQASPDHVSPGIFKKTPKHSYLNAAHEMLNSKSNSSKESSADSGKETCLANSRTNYPKSKANVEGTELESASVNFWSERKCPRNGKVSPENASFAHSKKEKQIEDNEKRLTALQERQKNRELQKKLIQGALTNLEHQSSDKQNHIIFDSDGENGEEREDGINEESSGKLQETEFTTKIPGKLFESSDDESDTADNEDDRFKIKPQFEGKAGEKLMHLQSRFGTDERFRMDARFLESDSEQEDEPEKVGMDEEEELVLEKKKNLEILRDLLHSNIERPKPSKQAANAKKFKDMNALRYDPTREDHVVFERKPETTEKESKAQKKKKKEEAQKLPEVSKEIFFDVTVDLKEVLRSAKPDEKTTQIPWDKCNDDMNHVTLDTEIMASSAGNSRQEETGGFTFSFFGAEEESSSMKEEPYVIETIKPLKVSWQEDPRFQDSSSEEEEAEVVEEEDPTKMSPTLPRSDIRFLFFSPDDVRLKEGPKLFCKPPDLDEDREYWESRRQTLLEDCRKKHKDARRKIKVKH